MKYEESKPGQIIKKVRSTAIHTNKSIQEIYENGFCEGMELRVMQKDPVFKSVSCVLHHLPLDLIRFKRPYYFIAEAHLPDWEAI